MSNRPPASSALHHADRSQTSDLLCDANLVNDVEDKLVELVRLSGHPATGVRRQAGTSRNTASQGPVVPGADRGDVVSGQDDVDELLSSLGF